MLTRPQLDRAVRQFTARDDIKNLMGGDDWIPMVDENGQVLEGIRARVGVSGIAAEGFEVGVDLIEMQPGSKFPLHTHPGDHVIFVHSGEAPIRANGNDHHMCPGDSVYVQGNLSHSVMTYPNAKEPFVMVVFGAPHKHVGSRERMKLVQEE